MAYFTKKTLRFIYIGISCLSLLFILLGFATYALYLPVLQSKESVTNKNNTGLTLLDDKGEPFFTFYHGKNKKYVPLERISDYAEKAVIATEDKEFYNHKGFSVKGIARSLYLNYRDKNLGYGGSTVTQQLVKNALLSSERSILRKYKELVLSIGIENKFSKNEILEMYLNSVYFGEGAFGIESASLTYFGKKASDLTLAESGLLIGILSSPSSLSPYSGDKDKAFLRQNYVLDQMLKTNLITQKEYDTAENSKLNFSKATEDLNNLAPHFAIMVRDKLIEKYGEETIVRSGYKVKTTLNSSWQKVAENIVARNVQNLAASNVTNGSAVVIEPSTGNIKSLVGSYNWYNEKFGKVNMATSPRQPGSSFKPIVFAKALEDKSITPATILKDIPTTFRAKFCLINCIYKPENYDKKHRGNVTARRALANSLNIPSVQIMEKVGVQPVLDKTQELSMELGDASNYGLSLVLGTAEIPLVEMTAAYASFANNGTFVEYNLIEEIIDKNGKNIYTDTPKKRDVWGKEIAFMISSILSDNRARAEVFGNALTISRQAAVKTGTTENYKDAWTIGYTPDLVVGVWVGNNDNAPMSKVAGSLGAAPIWRELIENYSQGKIAKNFEPPETLTALAVCPNGGVARTSNPYSTREYFLPGTEPNKRCGPSKNNFANNDRVPTVTNSISPTVIKPPDEKEDEEDEDEKFEPQGIGGGPPILNNDEELKRKMKEIKINIEEDKRN